MNWWGWMAVAWLAMSAFATAIIWAIFAINHYEGKGSEDEL